MTLSLTLATLAVFTAAEPLKPIAVLIIDGQNNHKWQETTPILKKALESTGRFQVDVATTPPKSTEGFEPAFDNYHVVVSNYNGQPWPEATQNAFTEFVRKGGGFVCVHAANNSFPQWPAYNDMIGVGGWGGRTEKSGPYLRLREGKFTTDMTPGRGGSHGPKHPFVVEIRNAEHPITAGLPPRWMHASDELYDRLRGPAKDVTVLASAFADSAKGGSGEHEPMLMVIPYGKGRVFHTPMGHDSVSMTCVGFQTVLTRGTEWAATGKVTIPVPADFPTADQIRQRE